VLPRAPRKSKRPRGERSKKIIKAQLEWWSSELGAYSLADLDSTKIAAARDKLALSTKRDGACLSPSTVVRYMAPLSHAFGVAVREWGWLDDSPMRKVERPAEPDGRVRFLSDDERGALLRACADSKNPWLYTVVLLALSTGMRKGELTNLRWPDVDLANRRITLRETKNGEIRVVPLTGSALDLIKAHAKVRRLDTDLVFPAPARPPKAVKPMDFRAAWEAALKRAGITNFHFHDLRHTTASYLAMNGASLAEIAEVLGHRTLAMVKRYAHLSEAHTASVMERMNERFLADSSQS
jgi:integrase